ncbi:MAG TPA: tetratricopeptide repeat protein [Crenalkalicoccus sp.]|jgi:tetratricopeptide (TPR) repeat protein|nr:tetratricopeptide repeat protein [Crenalkalicoccus sp.]
MLRLFSVSMPRAGHHVAEMVLGRLLGSRFSYCEFYTVRTCCKQIPCARIGQTAASGAIAFMQKSHDHNLTDPADVTFDGVLVQVREPVARALSNYELDLATVGPPHSPAYQRFWLGLEAAYTIGFIRKWCAKPDRRTLILKYEELLADPVTYYRAIFDRFELPAKLFDESKVAATQSVSSADKRPFKERDIRQSTYFDADGLSDFQRLVVKDSTALGYQPNVQLTKGGKSAAVALACEAQQRLFQKDQEGAIAALGQYLALPDAHAFGRRLRAQLLLAKGETAQAEADLRAVIAAEPGHPRAWLDLAELQRRAGQAEAARATLEDCLAEARDPGRASEWILGAFTDPEVVALARAHAPKPPVSREDVVAAFRFILGREPEGERVIESHQNVGSAAELRSILLRSTEFAEKYQKLLGDPAPMPRG